MHGVPWSQLAWEVTAARADRITAQLAWSRPDLLAVFPFPHRLTLDATLRPDGLTIETTLLAGGAGPVPIAFGFHPYLGLSNLRRDAWRLTLPAMRRLALDASGIPSGADVAFAGFDGPLGDASFDDGFALLGDGATFTLAGGGRALRVELRMGYPYAQVFAPRGQDFVALEPMTAPANALASGRGLRLADPGTAFRAAFHIGVGSTR
jgi:aldose 1-epimerase